MTIKRSTFRVAMRQSIMRAQIARRIMLTDHVPTSSGSGVAPSVTTQPSGPATADEGSSITATPGTYAGDPTPTLDRRYWETGPTDSGPWTEQGSTNSLTYNTVSGQGGEFARINEVYTNTEGTITGTSSPVAIEVVAVATPPSFTTNPSLSGTPKEGQVITCSGEVYEGDEPITISRQFKIDGVPVGVDQATHALVYDDVGATSITCDVTLTNAVDSVTVTTAAIGPVVQAPELLYTEYWEANDLRSALTDGEQISSWLGRNGLHTFTQTGTSRPTYEHGASVLLDVVDFDGTDDYFNCDTLAALFATGEDQTVVEAFKDIADTSLFRYAWSAARTSDSTTWIGDYHRFSLRYHYRRRSSNITSNVNVPILFDGDWCAAAVEEGPTGASRTVDVDVFSSADPTTPGGTANNNSSVEADPDTFSWGCRRITGSNVGFFYEGNAYSFGIKDAAWTATELVRWDRYCTDMGWI